ncbi:MAG: zf-HC2 domain-containing protein [Elusimicrobia bacterium]|nr:zf-HC2 domain-containing protein [Elusimicrobiota bacterium]
MAHEFSLEDLSAFLDDELPAERHLQVEAHLRSCPACSRELERFEKAGAAFREHGRRPLPAGLLGRMLRRLRPKSFKLDPTLEWGLILAVTLGIVLAGGVALKAYMPGLFSQIQQMISGAAGSLGQSN